MRKLVWAVVAGLLIAVGLVVVFRASIAERLMYRVALANMTQDTVAELPDGLHLAVCGAGSPLPDPERSGPCLAVIAGRTLLVVDAGEGGARNLQRMGILPGRISAVFLTHFHSDHIDGLGELAVLRWTTGSHHEPLPVYGPPGVERVVEGFDAAYALDAGYRTAHHGPDVAPPSGAGARAATFAVPKAGESEVVWQDKDAGIVVSAFLVDHAPATPAVGYRFDYAGRSLVVSGDTRPTPELVRAAGGADLLAHEALSDSLVGILHRAATVAGRSNVAKITHDILAYHTTPVQAARMATEAHVRHLLLYHIIPPLPLPGLASAFLDGVNAVYDGPVTLSRNGTFVSLPAGSHRVEVSQRL